MYPFEGFLESVHRSGTTIVARFAVGGFDPAPQAAPVLLLSIDEPEDIEAVLEELHRIQEGDAGSYVSVLSGTEAHVVTDHGNELTLVGKAVSTAEGQYEARDFERLAKQNYEWGQSQYQALAHHMACLAHVRAMLQEQHARISVKLQGHEPGSTARTLYEQHLSFISRALAEAGA